MAGDVITFSGDATDPEDGTLPASAFTWNIDFLHEGHVHPGTPITGVKSGTFTIPTSGHDFSGNTRYRITPDGDRLGRTDVDAGRSPSSRRRSTSRFDTVPGGLTLYLDGIAKTTPFVYDTLVGFNHTVEARNQTAGGTTYTFASWSDGGAQQQTIVVPDADRPTPPRTRRPRHPSRSPSSNSITRRRRPTRAPSPRRTPALRRRETPTSSRSAGIGDGNNLLGHRYRRQRLFARSSAGSRRRQPQPGDLLREEHRGCTCGQYSQGGLQRRHGLRRRAHHRVFGARPDQPRGRHLIQFGSNNSATSGSVTTTAANMLLFAAGMTWGYYGNATNGFTTRVITQPDLDIVADRIVNTVGSYAATAPVTGGGTWLMQLVAFKGVGGTS